MTEQGYGLKEMNVIDLTLELCPTIIRSDGTRIYAKPSPGLTWDETEKNFGQGYKHLLLRQVINADDQHWMHYVECESHLGTHVEVGSHLRFVNRKRVSDKSLLSVSELPVETWFGEASVFNFERKGPIRGKRQKIEPIDLEKVKKRDIVLMCSPYSENEAPILTEESVRYLIDDKAIKQLGGVFPFQGVFAAGENAGAQGYNLHDALLENNIPIIEGLIGLKRIKKERVIYIGLPLNMQGLDGCPIRAVVLEERD